MDSLRRGRKHHRYRFLAAVWKWLVVLVLFLCTLWSLLSIGTVQQLSDWKLVRQQWNQSDLSTAATTHTTETTPTNATKKTNPEHPEYQINIDWEEKARLEHQNSLFYHDSLQKYKIPHIFLFTHGTNILAPDFRIQNAADHAKEENYDYYGDVGRFRDNIRRTIKMYVEAWQKEDQEQQQQHVTHNNKNTTLTKPRVWFLDNRQCEAVIELVEPRLLRHFRAEPAGMFIGDICRAAAVYLSGGYYFDVDMKAIQPLLLPSTTTFSAPVSNSKSIFNSFIAAAPRHPIVYNSIQVMLRYYEVQELKKKHEQNEKTVSTSEKQPEGETTEATPQIWKCEESLLAEDVWGPEIMINYDIENDVSRPAVCYMIQHGGIGCYSLKATYDYYQQQQKAYSKNNNKDDIVMLNEDDFIEPDERKAWYPNLKQENYDGGGCDFMVHSREKRQAYFFSRMVGSGWYCRWKTLPGLPPKVADVDEDPSDLNVDYFLFHRN